MSAIPRRTDIPLVSRRFWLIRDEDASGVSGVGHVADGVVFPDGAVALRWRTTISSTVIYSSVGDVVAIHGHDGRTKVVFVDDPTKELPMRLLPHEVGPRIVQACIALTPCDVGDDAFKWICKDWGRKCTTCGYFASAVMWLVGVRGKIVNRSDEGCRYTPGANVSAIFNAGRYPFTLHTQGRVYPPGTILFVSEGPPNTEHIMVLGSIEGSKWSIFQGGGVGPKGEAMRKKDLTYDGRKLGGRVMQGGIMPGDMPILADDIDVVHVLPTSWFERPVHDPYTGKLAEGLE